MPLQFTKMQALGNDFVVIDAITQPVVLNGAQVRAIADRRFGIGCDQVLLVETPTDRTLDFRYRIFNADGSEAEQCGNGARCFARFVYDRGLARSKTLRLETLGGTLQVWLKADGQITVDMGKPRLEPAEIPFAAPARASRYPLSVAGQTLEIGAVSMGNPHAVVQVSRIEEAPLATLGPLLESHPRFPRRVNAGFMEVVTPNHIRLRVFERGVGETLACGSGACAAVVVGRVQERLEATVAVDLPGGRLHIHWPDETQPVLMTGPANYVFEGSINI